MNQRNPVEGIVGVLAVLGRLAAFGTSVFVAYQIWTGGVVPVFGPIGPSRVGAVAFFVFGSAVVDFAFKLIFFGLAMPIFMVGERAGGGSAVDAGP